MSFLLFSLELAAHRLYSFCTVILFLYFRVFSLRNFIEMIAERCNAPVLIRLTAAFYLHVFVSLYTYSV